MPLLQLAGQQGWQPGSLPPDPLLPSAAVAADDPALRKALFKTGKLAPAAVKRLMGSLRKAVTTANLALGRGKLGGGGGGGAGDKKRQRVVLAEAIMPGDVGGRSGDRAKRGNNLEGWDGESCMT